MGKLKQAVEWMINIANDSKHGYDQQYRWGERGDYDCSSLVFTAFENVGIKIKSYSMNKYGCAYTGTMRLTMLQNGFTDVTNKVNRSNGSGLQYGDILLNERNHVATYVGNGNIVQASINELGKATGGKAGDQKQLQGLRGEINICPYYNYPWDVVLRYKDSSVETNTTKETKTVGIEKCSITVNMPVLERGMEGTIVKLWQLMLCCAGYCVDIDGSFGNDTELKTIKFEKAKGIVDCPQCVGKKAWAKGFETLKVNKSF